MDPDLRAVAHLPDPVERAGTRRGDDRTRRLFEFLDRVCADGDLPPLAFRVAYALAQFRNRSTGAAWPRVATLARAVGAKPRTVQAAVKALEDAGYLDRETRGGGRSSVYRLLLDRPAASPSNTQAAASSDTSPMQESAGSARRSLRGQRAASCGLSAQISARTYLELPAGTTDGNDS